MKSYMSLMAFCISFFSMQVKAATLSPTNGPTAGGINITITAQGSENFEAQGGNSSVMLGSFGPAIINSWGTNSISIVLPAGVGENLVATITTQSMGVILSTNTFTYNLPVLTGLIPNHGPTVGGTSITVQGNNFGPAGTPATVTIGGAPTSGVVVTGHTSLTCLTPAGFGVNKTVVVTIGNQSSIGGPTFNYHAPTVAGVSPNSGPTIGGTLITISGTNFGPPGTMAAVTINGTNASSVTVISHTQISCITPSGVGLNHTIYVSVGGQSNSTGATFSYHAPTVNAVSPNNGPTAGGTSLVITGTNFGPPGTMATVQIGNSNATSVAVLGHTIITCTSPAGYGINQNVIVTVAAQSNNVPGSFSYNAPTVSGVTPGTGPTTGGTSITISGSNFGPPGTPATVLIGLNPASNVVVVNHVQIVCTTPAGSGQLQNVTVTVGGQSNVTGATFTYNPPVVTAITPESGPTVGGTLVTVTGNNFGPVGTSITASVDGISVQANSLGQTLCSFMTPPGSGAVNVVVITVNGQPSNSKFFAYNPPVINMVNPGSGSEQGGTLVTLTGNNFGPSSSPLSVTLGLASVSNLTRVNHTTITFVTPPGTGLDKDIFIDVDGQNFTLPAAFDYIPVNNGKVGIGTNIPNASAVLDISSTTHGILIPRMTSSERQAIPSPAEGLMVYDSTLHAFYFYNGSAWKKLTVE